ncbi:probable carboxylesterase 12 [Lycium ferocissimum]|uniref:probable carboxylesterase 12 n=1 Tax=Lycium ferocissimum TaxID=112874 RepID=UPI002814EDEB|nr:probable carboxylesterase 12 [Lycium ferocissimum]
MYQVSADEVPFNFPPFFRVYKDGRVERIHKQVCVPPSNNPNTGVQSKDVVVSPENNVSARLYLPQITEKNHKFPLLVYIHGGGFAVESAFSTTYDNYLHSLVAEANLVVVSIDYRLAPENPLPVCYDDTWIVLKWIASIGVTDEPWLKFHADYSRVFLAGDSAGANIAHDMMVRASAKENPLGDGVKIVGMVLIHPFFGNNEPDLLWTYICPESSGCDDPRLNPAAHPSLLRSLVCKRIQVFTAEKDFLRDRGRTYYEALEKSGWKGELEIMEAEGEEHVFHLNKPTCENAGSLMKRLVEFFNQP